VVIKASMSGVRRLFFVVKVRTKNWTALSSVYLCYLMFFLHVFWPGMTRQKLLFFKKPFKCPVLAASTLTPTLNCIFLMVTGVRIFDPNTGHLIGIKKNRSNGTQTTPNGLDNITAILYNPNFSFKNIFKNQQVFLIYIFVKFCVQS